ncbi:LexA regulated protein [Marinomonas transparens]|uniref:LexA regulated protein n=1 Tax=Marinomonas transparens TaxID=2795388 RepID=A0A934JPY6_9GAMM|nr:LexA regulated protein [Marinomonas transparens]MBJ7538528.1 LexA regulated protein [Marinomonas transparens]
MAKATSDRNTIDLFGKPVGRPRRQPLNRKEQLKRNKRIQREKEKALGMKRLELVIDQSIIDKLDQLCKLDDVKRAEWLTNYISQKYDSLSASQLKKAASS